MEKTQLKTLFFFFQVLIKLYLKTLSSAVLKATKTRRNAMHSADIGNKKLRDVKFELILYNNFLSFQWILKVQSLALFSTCLTYLTCNNGTAVKLTALISAKIPD